MSKIKELVECSMDFIMEDVQEANDRLCELIDTLTDENNRALEGVDVEFLNAMKEVGNMLYVLHEETIPLEKIDIIETMKGCAIIPVQLSKK